MLPRKRVMQSCAPGNHQRHAPGAESDQPVATEGVSHQQCVEVPPVSRLDRLPQPRMHARLPDVVKPLGQELHVHAVGRPGDCPAEFAAENLAGNQFQSHGSGKEM